MSTIKAKYFERSKLYYKLTFYAFVWSIIATLVFGFITINPEIKDTIIALPIFSAFIICPLGLVFSVLSYLKKEPFNKYRSYYTVGHLFFFMILIALIAVLFVDIKSIIR